MFFATPPMIATASGKPRLPPRIADAGVPPIASQTGSFS